MNNQDNQTIKIIENLQNELEILKRETKHLRDSVEDLNTDIGDLYTISKVIMTFIVLICLSLVMFA